MVRKKKGSWNMSSRQLMNHLIQKAISLPMELLKILIKINTLKVITMHGVEVKPTSIPVET